MQGAVLMVVLEDRAGAAWRVDQFDLARLLGGEQTAQPGARLAKRAGAGGRVGFTFSERRPSPCREPAHQLQALAAGHPLRGGRLE